jgi:hypothetical protein
MDEGPAHSPYDADLGGERVCWLDQVCPSCGAIGQHRAGCDLADPGDDVLADLLHAGPGDGSPARAT